MRPLIKRILWVVDRSGALLLSWLARARLFAQGVVLDPDVRLLGVPVVSREQGSSITIGARVVLCSLSTDTALGVSHAVVLRTIWPGAALSIGEDTGISGASIVAARSVTIGARCLLGADVIVADTDFHPKAWRQRRFVSNPAHIAAAPVVIEDDVFLGARSVVLKGVRVGRGAIVGSGAIVTRDVEPGTIVAGNPAMPIGRVPDADAVPDRRDLERST